MEKIQVNKFLNCFKRPVEHEDSTNRLIVAVDKTFLKTFLKEIKVYEDNISALTRRLWRDFIKNPISLRDHKESLKPKTKKRAERVTIVVSPGLHAKIKQCAKNEDYSMSFITRKLWKNWFDSHSN